MASTSDLAKETLLNGVMEIPLPLLVPCERQTAGRGQPNLDFSLKSASSNFDYWKLATSPPAREPRA